MLYSLLSLANFLATAFFLIPISSPMRTASAVVNCLLMHTAQGCFGFVHLLGNVVHIHKDIPRSSQKARKGVNP